MGPVAESAAKISVTKGRRVEIMDAMCVSCPVNVRRVFIEATLVERRERMVDRTSSTIDDFACTWMPQSLVNADHRSAASRSNDMRADVHVTDVPIEAFARLSGSPRTDHKMRTNDWR